MPPNNSSLTSALSRQMQPLRKQVDQIDLKILQLLQQRTKVSRQIGETKRRHGATIYVPERERALLSRLVQASEGKLPAHAVSSIYREIISSSRAEQGQAPIGVLRGSLAAVVPPARWCFGACDEFLPLKNWTEVAAGLTKGSLALALLTGKDLAGVLAVPEKRKNFLSKFRLSSDLAPLCSEKINLADRIFVVTPQGPTLGETVNRLVILMECKSTANAVKSLLRSMPARPLKTESLSLSASSARNGTATLLRVTLPQRVEVGRLDLFENPFSLLGAYPGTETYGG